MTAAPTIGELDLLKKFKVSIHDILPEMPEYHKTDGMLLNWIRAREGNLVKAEEMIRKASKWRKEYNFYDLHKWEPPQKIKQELPYEISGVTREGFPICVIPFGKWNTRQFVENGEKDLYVKYVLKMCVTLQQECMERSQLPNNVITQFAFIADFEGYSMRQLQIKNVEATMEAAGIFELQFPESLNKAIIIQTSKLFPVAFSIIKRVMTTRSLCKIFIFGNNPQKWKLELLKSFPADQYPSKYGSARLSLQNNVSKFESEFAEDLRSITIPPGEKLNMFFHVTSPNSQIRWMFKTDHYDIGFSIIFEDQSEIYPFEKFNSHIMTQEGSVDCPKPGTYFLVFDNSYSRLRGKTLHYKLYVSTSTVTKLPDLK